MTDNERIKQIAQQALDNIQDSNGLFQETTARIKADPVMVARLGHYNWITDHEDDVPAAGAFRAENAYWGEVFIPTQNQAMLDVVKIMQATIEEWIKGE